MKYRPNAAFRDACNRARRRRPGGFALIVTVSLMILLTLVAVGMLTLSAISLRTSGHGEAMMTARANARLALMLALGDLQKTMGPDRGISAPASAVVSGAARGHLTGAWESWRWNPEGSDRSPDYQDKADRFRQWLVSTANPVDAEDPNLPSKKSAGVELVGNTANDGVSNSVMAEKVPVNPGRSRGTLAWAVFDENLKADIGIGDPDLEPELGREIASRTAPHRLRADILSSNLSTLREPENLISMETARIPAGSSGGDEIHRHFHDFTHQSMGLAADVVNGRLKIDLSSALEPMAPDTSLLGGLTRMARD